MMTRRDWWLGVALIVVAILVHAAMPRYEWQTFGSAAAMRIRIDRWTGTMQLGAFTDYRWVALRPAKPAVAAAVTTRPPLPPIGTEVPAFVSTDPRAVDAPSVSTSSFADDLAALRADELAALRAQKKQTPAPCDDARTRPVQTR